MIKVLFVCVHNSARSQIAETLLNDLGKGKFLAESAGLEPGVLNPFVIRALNEVGYDISDNKTKSVFDFFKQDKTYDYVITVCDGLNGEKCPVFPGNVTRLHWDFEDPKDFTGTDDEILVKTNFLIERMGEKILSFINSF